MKKLVLAVAALAVCAVGGAWWYLHASKPSDAPVVASDDGTYKPKSIAGVSESDRDAMEAALDEAQEEEAEAAEMAAERAAEKAAEEAELTPAEQKLSDAVQDALDDNDFSRVVENAREALKSDKEELRQQAVDALGWFGPKALKELTSAMLDKSEEVAESARAHMETALGGMDDQKMAFDYAATYLATFCDNKDAANMLSGIMTSTAIQFIDPDDPDSIEDIGKAKARRAEIVAKIQAIMAEGEAGEAVAKDVYHTITGDEWTDAAAATAWANDIADPDPDESDEPEEPEEDDDDEA
ncbi:MAG: HEAT repeat domain-containing protein [Kiritimatiellae bacterium]|nr:HEAT repeat domain-containing protein [Kiritimatiellia bacterium]